MKYPIEQRRVVVTGIGVISALGDDRGAFWRALAAGCPGIRPLKALERSEFRFQLRIQNAAEVQDYDSTRHFEPKQAGFLDRFAQFAVVAAREAVAEAGLVWTDELRERTIVVTGSCVGGQDTEDSQFVDLYLKRSNRVHPLTIPRVMSNAGASHISMEFGLNGPAWTVSTACSSSNHAIGQAFWMIRSGAADLALTGGSEAPFSTGHLKAWEALRVVAPDTCRPFSKDRKGMILGEGGAMLVLEELEQARRRGARIWGEIVGFGMSADAHHLTQPSSDGPARAMRAALADARLEPDRIGYINAHGTGTQANDVTESTAIHAVFGEHAPRIPVSSTKSMHGHTLGAAGAIEAAATLMGLAAGLLPPTANFTELDPACPLEVVANRAREQTAGYALSNSFAFGGLNAVLALARWDGS